MKTFVMLFFVVASASASASEISRYEQIYLDCIDFSHQPSSPEKEQACRDDAKSDVLMSNEAQMQFLDCVDYYHRPISQEREESCLKEIK